MKAINKFSEKNSLLFLLLLFFILLAYTPVFAFIPGDVNNDGVVDVKDLSLVIRYTMGYEELSESQIAAADMNQDGVVNSTDVFLIMQNILGFTTTAPEPADVSETIPDPVLTPDPEVESDPEPLPEPVFVGRVNINTAGLEDLKLIKHIDEVRGQEIINTRPFHSIEELLKISGIGAARLQDIKDQGVAYVE